MKESRQVIYDKVNSKNERINEPLLQDLVAQCAIVNNVYET